MFFPKAPDIIQWKMFFEKIQIEKSSGSVILTKNFQKKITTHFWWSVEYWLHFQKFVTNSVDTVKTLYRLDGLSIIEDTIAVLHKAVNRWRTITSPLYDSSRPNSLTHVLDLEAKKYEEMEFERYSFFTRYSFSQWISLRGSRVCRNLCRKFHLCSLRLKDPKSIKDLTLKALSKTFKHDFYSSANLKTVRVPV